MRGSGLRIPTSLESTTISNSSSTGNVARQWSPHSFTLFVSNAIGTPRRQQLPGLVHDRPVHADRHLGHEREVRVHVDRLTEHLGRPLRDAGEPLLEGDLADLHPVPVVGDRDATVVRHGDGRRRVLAALDADVGLVAEEQLEHGARGVAHVGFELPDAAEERAREHAAVVEDHRLDHRREGTGSPDHPQPVRGRGWRPRVGRWPGRGCRPRWRTRVASPRPG